VRTCHGRTHPLIDDFPEAARTALAQLFAN